MLVAPSAKLIRRRLGALVVLPLAATGGVFGALALSLLNRPSLSRKELAAVGMATALMTLGALVTALRGQAPKDVAVRTLGASLAFAVTNGPLSVLALWLIQSATTDEVLSLTAISLSYGLVISVPLGFLWALVLTGPMYGAAKLRNEPSLDGMDRAMRLVGDTLAGVCTLGALLSLENELFPVILFALALGGAAVSLIASLRLLRFRNFLRRAAVGDEAEWAVVPRGALSEDLSANLLDDLPSSDHEGHPNGVLVRKVAAETGGAYRTGRTTLIPWARTAV